MSWESHDALGRQNFYLLWQGPTLEAYALLNYKTYESLTPMFEKC
jgi:hypothetical protein